MADIKKFLDSAGVGVLWGQIAAEIEKVNKNAEVADHETRLATAEGKIAALEAGTYDDTEIRGLITTNANAIATNLAAINTLNGDVETTGSVKNVATDIATTAAAAKVAEIVAGADASFDTLKEIADWIINDDLGAADMATSIATLKKQLTGIDAESTVVAAIADAVNGALKVDGVEKYALASELTTLAGRVKALEDAGYQNAAQVGSAIDAKIAALDLANAYDAKGAAATAETNAKAHAESLNTAMDTRVKVLEAIDHTKFESAGAAAQALVDAKAYTDQEVAKIQALTDNEILAAIDAAKVQG